MERYQFKVTIDAPREKVWKILWGDDTYPQWTSAFSEGSHAETDWKKGSKVIFLDGKNQGMVSTVAENIPDEFMSFKHLGTVKDGVEDFESEETKSWSGAIENYTLKTVNGKTELTIDQDITDEYKEMFFAMWPNALKKLKALAEENELVSENIKSLSREF
jgi:hypothetical protein